MLKALGWLAGVVALIVVVVLLAASRKPDTFRVERAIDIAAAPGKIAPLVQDLTKFAFWSPWQHLDPKMRETFSGPPTGVGSVLEWQGNSKAGAGRMEVLRAVPLETTIQLEFIKPFHSVSNEDFVLTPLPNGGTHVVWTMSGPMNLMSKVMCVFKNMDAMIGPDFEHGLANLKREAEDPTKP